MLKSAAGERPLIFYLIPEKDHKAASVMDEIVLSFATKHGIPVLSNYQEFSRDDYFELDGHWRPSGHAKAARYLQQALVQLGF